jgi:GMP synthase (glutamine-hydrolysing)
MTRLRVAFCSAAHDDADTRRNFRRELDTDLVEFDATNGQLPPSFDFDAAVISGSGSSVYHEEAWIEDLVEWTREAHETGMPILGVCFGHQVIAAALGGTVEHMGEYEIGYREVERTAETPLLEGVDERFTVFVTHQDSVVELPPGAEAFAANEYGNHGFRVGQSFGVQFHPEYDTETAREVTLGKDLSDEKLEGVLEGINDENFAAACEAKVLFENFVAYVREVREIEPVSTH